MKNSNHKHCLISRRLVSLLMLGLTSGLVATTSHAGLSQLPLYLTTSVEPNVMLMLDNSGSMSNIVPDAPYNPATTYFPTCPSSNLVPAGTSVDISLVSSRPRILYSGFNYTLGTGSGQRCFATATTYSARLNLNGNTGNTTVQGGYLDAEYTGNYLNWYFNANNTTPTWTAGQQKKPGTQSRIEIARTSAKNLVDSLDDVRLGLSTYNAGDGGSLREIVGDLDAAKIASVKTKVDALTASGNTPLAETLSDIGRYFATGATGNLTLHPGKSNQTTASVGTVFNSHNLVNNSSQTITDPIQNSCQKSFAVLMTDGRPQGDRAISASLRDYTGDCAAGQCDATPNSTDLPSTPLTNTGGQNGTKIGRTYENQGSDYLDDVAKGLFEIDLRPDLVDPEGTKNNLITYTIGFADSAVANDPLLIDTGTRGGGQFFTAADSSQLEAAFQNALIDIASKPASASAVAANSSQLKVGTQIFQAKFDSSDWSGGLEAFNVDPSNGTLTSAWVSSLPAFGSRNIFTYKSSEPAGSRGVLFEWANLSKNSDSPAPLPASQQAYLNTLKGTVDATKGTLRLNWLRGDDANEKLSAADTNPLHFFRERNAGIPPAPVVRKILGDIINSDPVYVSTEDFGYGILPSIGPSYRSFRGSTAYANRRPMLYVGANDGMLHGFDANKSGGGAEVFAYVPNALFPELSKLTATDYNHQYYVDGPIGIGDVYDGTTWHTVLAGTTGAGGRAVFALDVTDPNAFGASNALWEFTRTNRPDGSINPDGGDLGYTMAQPSVVRMQDGSWAVIVANGYYSDNGHAVLFILNALTGAVLQKIDTGVGSTTNKNGLSTPVAVDTNNDRMVDTVYAGDLYGNLWKFNLSGSAGSWPVPANPLFVACTTNGTTCPAANRQPITSKPSIGKPGGTGSDQNGVGLMVYFGTGKYFETIDNNVSATSQVQAFYGLWDNCTQAATTPQPACSSLTPINDRAKLQEQTITFEGTPVGIGTANASTVRSSTRNTVCYGLTTPATGDDPPAINCNSTSNLKRGWAMTLVKPTNIIQGERVVSPPVFYRNLVLFSTLIPRSDPCRKDPKSRVMVVDALTGKRPTTSSFDLFDGTAGNSAGKVDAADMINVNGNLVAATGVDLEVGGHGSVTIVGNKGIVSGSTGDTADITLEADVGSGRKSWRQLK